MVERDALLNTLPDEVRDSAERLYAEVPDPDPHDIVAELHRRGLLRDDQLRSALLTLEGSLRGVRMRARPPAQAGPTYLGPLGAGAMGEVLLAKDEGLNRIVAVKRLLPDLQKRPAVVSRFYREAQITAQLDHPAIVPIHALVSAADGTLAYSMKLVRGETLEDYLLAAREGWVKTGGERGIHVLSARLERFLQVCEAVAYANDRGVVHRDLKPENIMVGAFGQVIVMDWGIAKVLQSAEMSVEGAPPPPPSPGATRVGAVFGTPRYMSPEQAQGANDKVDARADQYSLGLILSEIVTLQSAMPEHLDMDACILWAGTARRRPMKHVHRKGPVPRELAAIVDKATALQKERRYPNVQALADDVRRYLRDEPVLARPDTLGQRLHRWVGRHRSAMLTLVLFLSFLVVVVGLTLLSGAIGAIELRRRAALAHEEAITAVLSAASEGASEVHGVMDEVDQALAGLSYAAEAALQTRDMLVIDPAASPFTVVPERLRRSEVYGNEISLLTPSLAGPAASDELVRAAFALQQAADALSRPLVDSATDEHLGRKERFELVGKQGAPVRWVRVATRDGLVATMPWTQPFRSGVNGKNLPWYREDDDPGAVWAEPHIDVDGTGLVITGTRPLFGPRGQVGTAAVDVTAQALIRELLPPKGARDAMIVDPKGKVVLWNGLQATTAKSWAPRDLPIPELMLGITRRREGVQQFGSVYAAWAPIEPLGWRYLVLVDEDRVGELVAGQQR